MTELAAQFERTAGHKVAIRWEVMPRMKRQIDEGATFNAAILTPDLMDDAIKQSQVDAATRTVIARTGAGLAVRKGAAKPDIGSVDAFKRALLAAGSIGYTADGAAGNAFLAMLERLGIAAELKPKLKPLPGGGAVVPVAKGEVEVTVTTIPGILEVPGADLVGPLPAELQNYVVYTMAVGRSARDAGAARALISFLATPAAVSVMVAKGLDPPPR